MNVTQILLSLLSATLLSHAADTNAIPYSTIQEISPSDSPEIIAAKAAHVLPRPNQVSWQRLEETFFIHFGPNAFSGVEWGTGKEDPKIFNPTQLDATQWVKTVKQVGGKMIMLVVKHHDGFCLWPSRYNNHSVAASPWRNGKGNLVFDVAKACHEQGIQFGVYLSPADLFQIENPKGYYGRGSKVQSSTIPTDPAAFATNPTRGRSAPAGKPTFKYDVDDYNRYFLNQLYELLSEYGPIAEVWFDGANPKQTNPPQQYNRQAWYELIRTLQPNAMIAIKGPDCRWIGNEQGTARESEWSVLPIPAKPHDCEWNDMMGNDIGNLSNLAKGKFLVWYPGETDVPVLHGWFWKQGKSARTAQELINIYYTSVGRNSNLLLNLSPDSRGIIPQEQTKPLFSMHQVIRATFANNLADNAKITASTSAPKHEVTQILDNNLDTWWEPTSPTAELTLQLAKNSTFDVISLQEAIAQRGQRIEKFAIDAWLNNNWQEITSATTVGHKRLLRLDQPITTDRVRIRIIQSRLEPSIAQLGLFLQSKLIAEPTFQRLANGNVEIKTQDNFTAHYTLDGSTPTPNSPSYTAPIPLAQGGTIHAIAVAKNDQSLPSSQTFGIFPTGWLTTASSATQPATNTLDNNPSTLWQSAPSSLEPWIAFDLKQPQSLRALTYLPRQDGNPDGLIEAYRVEISQNGTSWVKLTSGNFDNIRNNPIAQTIDFPRPIHTRYIRLIATKTIGTQGTTAAEIFLLPATPPPTKK